MPPSAEQSLPLPPDRARRLRHDLLAWYDGARRVLPWRAREGATAAAWPVLVSEIMLQQTTVATVARRFEDFLARFPSPAAMAAQPLEAVLHAWQGLGYYRRARGLHACAQALVARHGGRVPADPAALRALPGIGDYTAHAVAAIAFAIPVVPIDANVRRVLSRVLGSDDPATIRLAADALASPDRASDLAQALMELGALVCTARSAACLACPWQQGCVAATSGQPVAIGRAPGRAARPERVALAFLLRRPDGAILFRQRPETGLLAGMIELPTSPFVPAGTELEVAAHAPLATDWRPVAGSVRHLFTHLGLTVRIVAAEADTAIPGIWSRPAELGGLALPTLTRKLLRHGGVEAPSARAATQSRQASVM